MNAHDIVGYIEAILERSLFSIMGEKFNTSFSKVSLASSGFGDFSFGCFMAAKEIMISPVGLAERIVNSVPILEELSKGGILSSVKAVGPYVNFNLNRIVVSQIIMSEIEARSHVYGHNTDLSGKTIMVEFLAPNTNKPLHIGHLRNGVIGNTVARLLSANGANVIRANNINDRGIHIVQSMLAYMLWGNGETPESTGEKGDHFVGRYYVKFHQAVDSDFKEWLIGKNITIEVLDGDTREKFKGEHKTVCPLILKTQEMLSAWERGDSEVVALWEKMNNWVYAGFNQTNERIGFLFDIIYYESQTYKLGRSIIQDQLAKGVCQQATDGSVVIDLTSAGLGAKPISLLRRDGTSLYITQDIGLAATRFEKIPGLNGCIYVVAREQEFHFKVLFEVLRRYEYQWWNNLYHLSYGMVNLPSGKMKSREGTVVDADELMDQLRDVVIMIAKKDECVSEQSIESRAEIIAQSALKYMLLSVSPNKDMLFDPNKSVSFEGNTGPYLQYACVRIKGIVDKASKLPQLDSPGKSISDKEFKLVKMLLLFPEMVKRSAKEYDPSILASGLYEIAQAFSTFYVECPVIHDGRANSFRLNLCMATRQVLSNGLVLLDIGIPDKM